MVKIPKKAALICALVMMVSMVPAFALNDTDNSTTTTDQSQGQNCNGNHNPCQGSCDSVGDENQNQYQYGQKNCAAGTGNCDGTNCPNT